MSHEIRTPLNGVTGSIQLLLDSRLDAAQSRFAGGWAQASGDALLTVINDILDFSKIEAGKMELENIELDPQLVVEQSMDIVWPRARERGFELASYTDPRVCRCLLGDPDRLRQILINLANNAVKFTERGSIVVRVTQDEETAQDAVVRISVRDSGIGIAPDRLDRLFKSFSQVDSSTTRKHGGTGLGLVICKQLAEMMGGEIGVDSQVGQGTTFWFTVRLAKPKVASRGDYPGESGVSACAGDRGRRKRIPLFCWSNLGVGVFIPIRHARGRKFWKLRTANILDGPFDLVLCDAKLPEMDVLTVGRLIQESPDLEGTVVMALTSLDEQFTGQALADAGIAGCITKPVHQSQLFNTIMNVMAEATGDRERFSCSLKVRDETPASSVLRGARVLVAEDNEINQLVTGALLERIGCKCEIAANGALRAAAGLHGKI